jgi:hypothetical protein
VQGHGFTVHPSANLHEDDNDGTRDTPLFHQFVGLALAMIQYTGLHSGSTADTIGLVFWDVGAGVFIAAGIGLDSAPRVSPSRTANLKLTNYALVAATPSDPITHAFPLNIDLPKTRAGASHPGPWFTRMRQEVRVLYRPLVVKLTFVAARAFRWSVAVLSLGARAAFPRSM